MRRTESAGAALPRTRFDRTRRNILIGLVLAVVILLSSGAVGLIATQGGRDRRSVPVTPRSIDIWAVSASDGLRFVTLIHAPPDTGADSVNIAGPLVASPADLLAVGVLGGELESSEVLPGPGHDQDLIYLRLTIQPEGGRTPYGVDVLSASSPYLTIDPLDPALRVLSLGTKAQDTFRQQIVAVALPPGALLRDVPEEQPYRRANVSGWEVLYFDTTQATGAEVLRVTYTLDDLRRDLPDLNPYDVDRQR